MCSLMNQQNFWKLCVDEDLPLQELEKKSLGGEKRCIYQDTNYQACFCYGTQSLDMYSKWPVIVTLQASGWLEVASAAVGLQILLGLCPLLLRDCLLSFEGSHLFYYKRGTLSGNTIHSPLHSSISFLTFISVCGVLNLETSTGRCHRVYILVYLYAFSII